MKNSIKMLKAAVIALTLVAAAASCHKEDEGNYYDGPDIYALNVILTNTSGLSNLSGIGITIQEQSGAGYYEDVTSADGKASFNIPAGVYSITASGNLSNGDNYYICNGSLGQVTIREGVLNQATIKLSVAAFDTSNSLIIKEIYNGGVMKDDNSGNFQYDKCIILYNNSPVDYVAENLAITMGPGYNADAASTQKLYTDGKLSYADENFIPGYNGIWYFQDNVTIKAFSSLVVNVHGAIDNTQTVSNSVNYANEDYYCMYDPEYEGPGTSANNKYYNNTSYYPAPADVIPTSHYLKTVKLGQGNAWGLSVTSPTVFIYRTDGTTPKEAAEDVANEWYHDGYSGNHIWRGTKILREWILDGVEVWNAEKISSSVKRLTDDIDVGHVNLTNKLGHSLYRNVNKEATEALPENEGLIVYNYSLGVGDSTDPSGIDAEASIKNGAHIVYQDTNNSSKDFHERSKCSLRGE